MGSEGSKYGVELVRGPVVELDPHPDSCASLADLIELLPKLDGPFAADLFCGAGGLSLGLADAGFDVVVGVDNDEEALTTHSSLFPGLHLDWDLSENDRVEELGDILTKAGVSLIAGGPPCQPFSKAGRSLLRDLVRSGRRPPEDRRRDLWQSFLAVIDQVRPAGVLMENVPDMALERDMMIIRTMVDELESMGYGVEAQVVDAWRYGVPQHRQRLILVGIEGNTQFAWSHERIGGHTKNSVKHTKLKDAIGDLPPVNPGWHPEQVTEGWIAYDGPESTFQERARERVEAHDRDKVYDHITRSVREDDAEAFALMDHTTKYSDLPDELKRYRDDIFDDKYKRLDYNDLSRSITAHIAKDGYWYIHPDQDRTLTIREAARIQTFRDDVRFAGSPTSAFRQIGNAVPPLLAEGLGVAILDALTERKSRSWATRDVSADLANWIEGREFSAVPWLSATTRWSVIQAEMLLARARPHEARMVWRVISKLDDPSKTVAHSLEVLTLARHMGRYERGQQVVEAAKWYCDNPSALLDRDDVRKAPHVTDAPAELAFRVVPSPDDDPILGTHGVPRVAARFHESDSHKINKRSDGRMETARLVGVDPLDGRRPTGHLAHLALIELAAEVCLPSSPHCPQCPLLSACPTGQRHESRQPRLSQQR